MRKLDAIGERVKALRETMGPDSPLAGVAFEIAAFIGTTQAALASAKPATEDDSR